MFQEERLIAILNYLENNKRISVEQICTLFHVSRDTARRDLVRLEEEQKIIRTRGGAILPTPRHEVKDYANRLKMVSSEKKRIGQGAASLIQDGERIILDTSTTVQACAENMGEISCTVITNSINQAEILSSNPNAEILLLGGMLQKEHRFLYGSSVIEKLSQYQVDKAFIGVVGLSESGLSLAHEEDGMVKRKMISQADQVIVLADHTKIGVNEFFKFAELSDVDLLITDKMPEKAFIDILERFNVELLIAEG
ncbi:DeoR/GlpR transcriptional regulator [Bacillus sp. ISL-47]|uniref:DeoR/GlpR family DNA-binding transcription regulator n=1 Tax=Bacillus sp. ISL-47 TaxID=2819130 RepID=UPI001BE97B6E|nr:DeoR/GlpR family DNA-binding transcription regulator [Bacillus sp. ISL-47]MBT2687587.1 DeoR/GlpR transcriptional regulator [Bacillus sp. ISL-47]MBT2706416.1 DeoR/GlpR transcriptional regulator [Pseudomonas sp. ISL-84]